MSVLAMSAIHKFGFVCNEPRDECTHQVTEIDAENILICPKLWFGNNETESAFFKAFPIDNILDRLDSEVLKSNTRNITIIISSFHLMVFTRRIVKKLQMFKNLKHLKMNVVPVNFNKYRKEDRLLRVHMLKSPPTPQALALRDLPLAAIDCLDLPIQQLNLETYEIAIRVDFESRKDCSQPFQDLLRSYAETLKLAVMNNIEKKHNYKLIRATSQVYLNIQLLLERSLANTYL